MTGRKSQVRGIVTNRSSPLTIFFPNRSRPSHSRWGCSSISLLPPPLAPSCMMVTVLSYGVTTCTVEP